MCHAARVRAWDALEALGAVRERRIPTSARTSGPAGTRHVAFEKHRAVRLTAALLLGWAGPWAHASGPPAPERSLRAFSEVVEWVQSLEAPAGVTGATRGFSGASVTLRLGGRVLGRGSEIGPGDGAPVLRAARTAIEEARERLPLDRDALWEERARLLAGEILVDVELAGPLIPLPGKTDGERRLRVRPGLHGVAFRLGDEVAGVFPGEMLSTGTSADLAMGRLRVELTGRIAEALEPDRASGGAYYRFETTQVAQIEPGGAGVFLHRGGRVAPGFSGLPELRAFADRLAARMLSRVVTGEDGDTWFAGTLDPLTGRFEPERAKAWEVASAAFALARYAEAPGVDGHTRNQALQVARELVRASARGEGPGDDVEAAMWLLAYHASGASSAATDRFAEACVARARDGFIDGRWREGLSISERAALAAALAFAARSDEDRLIAREALGALYERTGVGDRVGLLPWVGWAELELAGPNERIAAAPVLRETRALVWLHQVTPTDVEPPDADWVGGVVFTGSSGPLPSWTSLRPLSFIATMLGDARLTPPAERGTEIARLMRSLRFVRQLSAAREEAHMYRSPSESIGGVRISLRDQRMPPAATAFALVTVSEALASLEWVSTSP